MKSVLLYFMLMALSPLAWAQFTVKGVVTADDGSPIPGVSVLVKGTARGTVTDLDGNFALQVDPSATLVFSYVGMLAQEVEVGSQTEINISLVEDISQLEEVVVTGYTAERQVDVTGAVAVVDLKPIKNNSSGNPMQALQGQVAGLLVEKTGTPTGGNSRILIRGVNTLGNNDPLYVIDGVPTKRSEVFQSLSPSTIQSVQVLKDASAASIYGSRASNGVIVVTTKDGISKSGDKVSVAFNSTFSIQNTKAQRLDMLNAEDRGRALWQGSVNDGTDPAEHSAIYTYDWNNDFNNPVLNSVTVQPFVGGDPNVPVGDTDWQDATYETGYVTANDLTLTAGNDKSGLLINLGYVNNSGVLVHTGYERYSARINANTKFLDDKVKIGVNSQFVTSNETLESNDLGGAPVPFLAITLAPTIPVYTADGEFAGPVGAGYSDRNNPAHMQYINRWDNTNRKSLFANAYVQIEPIENLIFKSNIGIDYSNVSMKDINVTFQEGFLGRDVNSLNRTNSDFLGLTWSNTLQYEVELGRSRINVLAGVEAIWNDSEEFGAYREGFAQQTEDFFYISSGTGRNTNFGRATGSRLLAQFGKVNYIFDDKYLASVTLRRDGSSRFGEDNKYGFFPAATVGWRVINEPFMQNMTAVSNLKLRAGVGRVGNQEIGDVARLGLYEPRYGTRFNNGVDFPGQWLNVGTAYDLGGVNSGSLPSGFVSVQGANSDLKWETTEEVNVGVEFGFWNDKLIGSFDYFTRETYDILLQPPLASAVGEGKIKWVNGATKTNKGWEFVLNYRNTLDNGISYGINGNLSRYRDKITQLPEEVRTAFPGNSEKTILGQSELSIFGYKTDGLFQNQAEVDAHAEQVGAGVGRIKYVDLNNDGVINALDQDYLGTTLPGFEYGIRIDLAYKNFDFSVFGSGVGGRSGFEPYIFWNNFLRVRENMGSGVLDAWTPQNMDSDIPMLTLVDVNNETRTSDYFNINTSYFKLRNIQLGYSFPTNMLQPIHLESLRVFVMGENLMWIKSKDYQGADPEVSNFDLIPVPTSFTFGVNAVFN
ncbi:TonB-dependent receptor [Flammeovirgaceae bacterium SG7u.111]|nr:TonB-dependent receptor [Flammeovirgaceae bacterium SG7u.132]WPO34999.1 TonB-dependent receptor [Flammeovirgaceae bacterium SG7u.111]